MINLEKAVVAKLKTYGENFEILVDPDLALEYKRGKIKDIRKILASEFIFKDAKKAEKASTENIKKIFKTDDLLIVADQIIKKGEIELTTEQKRRMLEERKRRIIDIIAKNSINPQTKSPNPPARIEAAMELAKVRVVLEKSAEEQVDEVVKAIREFLPIKFEKIKIAAKIPIQYSAHIYNSLRGIEILKQEYTSDSVIILIEIPAGIQDEVFGKLNALTKGNVQTKILK